MSGPQGATSTLRSVVLFIKVGTNEERLGITGNYVERLESIGYGRFYNLRISTHPPHRRLNRIAFPITPHPSPFPTHKKIIPRRTIRNGMIFICLCSIYPYANLLRKEDRHLHHQHQSLLEVLEPLVQVLPEELLH